MIVNSSDKSNKLISHKSRQTKQKSIKEMLAFRKLKSNDLIREPKPLGELNSNNITKYKRSISEQNTPIEISNNQNPEEEFKK